MSSGYVLPQQQKDLLTNKEYLVEEYLNKNRSLADLSKEIGIGESTLRKYLGELNISKTKEQQDLCSRAANIKKSGNIFLGRPAEEFTNGSVLEKLIAVSKLKDREFLYQEYIVKNRTKCEIANELQLTESSLTHFIEKFDLKKDSQLTYQAHQKTMLTRYGVAHPILDPAIKEKTQKTNQERYGFNSSLQNEEVKRKIKQANLKNLGVEMPFQSSVIQEKARQTVLEKYGVENAMENPEVLERNKKSVLEKYGVENVFQSEEIKVKIKQSMMEHYGVDNPSKSPEISEKKRQTSLARYGTESPTQSDVVKSKMKKTNLERYGVEYSSQNKAIQERSKLSRIESGTLSTIEGKILKEIAEEYQIPYTTACKYQQRFNCQTIAELVEKVNQAHNSFTWIEQKIADELQIEKYNRIIEGSNLPYRPDFKLTDQLYLNVDGLVWHSDAHPYRELESDYHFKIRQEFEQQKLRILTFREDEIKFKFDIVRSMINNALNKTENKIFARKTKIQKVKADEAKEFLEANHIMGSHKSRSVGLYHQDELVSILNYRKHSGHLEVDRFCSKINTSVVGAFGKLLKHVLKDTDYQGVNYWVDLRYGTGEFLKQFGFKFQHDVLSFRWTDLEKTYNRRKCRANMDERKLSEKEHAEELGWYKIYDAGQRLYTLDLKK